MWAHVRQILLHLRLRDIYSAKAVYQQLRRQVVKSVTDRIIFHSDAEFLFEEVLTAIVLEALAAEQGSRLQLTSRGNELYQWAAKLARPISSRERFAGATNILLHGQCQSLYFEDQLGRTCDAFDADPRLCRGAPLCATKSERKSAMCDKITGKGRLTSCCGCGGGKKYTDPAQTKKTQNKLYRKHDGRTAVQIMAKK